MSSPMTLREALALIDDVRADRSYCAAAGKHFAPPADLARARAIVDAMAEAVRGRLAQFDGRDGLKYQEAIQLETRELEKLRALTRGEGSEVQP